MRLQDYNFRFTLFIYYCEKPLTNCDNSQPPHPPRPPLLPSQEFPLGRYNNKKDLKDAVKKMAYMERGTMTGQALRYLTDSSFAPAGGARPGVAKVGIVFTDGRSQDYIGDAAKKAKEQGEGGKKGECLRVCVKGCVNTCVVISKGQSCSFCDVLLWIHSA